LKLNLGIIGCGLIGQKRANFAVDKININMCYDSNLGISQDFAAKFACNYATSLDEIIDNENIDVFIVATRHESLASISKQVIKQGKHLFIEKPGALNYLEFSEILETRTKFPNVKIHVGYNHRYHPGINKALEIYKSGNIGELMFIRARYGHGGRLGYENEWRSKKSISGGGELIDQGSHLLDLAQAFLGEISLDYAATPNYFWNMEVEDNAFISVKNKSGNIAFLQASCTEWKNMFSLEVYCKFGKIDVSGLGGSYGIEKVVLYKMTPEMGPPFSEFWEYSEKDESWGLEFQDFIFDIENDTSFSDNLESSKRVLEIIAEIYHRTGR
jgi:predicted dehydrogenase